jgi:thioredoxin reductase
MIVFDVIIIGGGPAGLNAAVVLGKCRRKVLLFDHGKQRNRFSEGMRNYLTRDNISPINFLKISRNEIKNTVSFLNQLKLFTLKNYKQDIFL